MSKDWRAIAAEKLRETTQFTAETLKRTKERAAEAGKYVTKKSHEARELLDERGVIKAFSEFTNRVGCLFGKQADNFDFKMLPEEQRIAWCGCLLAVAGADGETNKDQVTAIFETLDTTEMSEPAREEIRSFLSSTPPFDANLETLAKSPPEVRYALMAAMTEVAMADGDPTDQEKELIERAQTKFAITPEQMSAIEKLVRALQKVKTHGNPTGAPVIYQSLIALAPVKKVLDEAGCAIADKARTIKTSGIPEALGAVAGGAVGVGIGVAAVSAAGSIAGLGAAGMTSGLAALGSIVGGGMLAGIFVAGAPMAALGVGGYAVLSWRNNRKLLEAKEALYQDALLKHDAIIKELDGKVELTQQRLDYLNSLNVLLREIIGNLEKDLHK